MDKDSLRDKSVAIIEIAQKIDVSPKTISRMIKVDDHLSEKVC